MRPPASVEKLSGYSAGNPLLIARPTIRAKCALMTLFLSTIRGTATLFLNSRECGFEIIGTANFQALKCHPQCLSCDLHLSQRGCVASISRLRKNRDAGDFRECFLK